VSTLLVDNYDSYTYNVFHLLAAVSGEEPIVVHNDMISWRALSRWDFDAIVLSPGPGSPERWHDFGVCSDILRSSEIPVLGICLGHQGLGRVLSGMVASAPQAMHGRLSHIQHVGSGLFRGIPQDFSVVRYHSLAVTGPLGPDGRETAWTEDGVVMGIEHARRPLWGVQFHPESIATEHGRTLVENFYALARSHRSPSRKRRAGSPSPAPRPAHAPSSIGGARTELSVRTVAGEPSTELLFERLFGDADDAFWLDSAGGPKALAQCSYMGTSAGADRCVLEYDVDEGTVTTAGVRTTGVTTAGVTTTGVRTAGVRTTGVRTTSGPAAGVVEYGSIFDVLNRELAARAIAPPAELARGLVGGFVGYLGYECKADCGSPNVHHSDIPDAVLMFANRVVAVDHIAKRTHLIALGRDGGMQDAERWLDEAEVVVREMLAPTAAAGVSAPTTTAVASAPTAAASAPTAAAAAPTAASAPIPAAAASTLTAAAVASGPSAGAAAPVEPGEDPVVFRCGRGREQYLADIARCQAALAAGESYEVCLTDQISTDASPDPLALYRLLRHSNPAPFAAYVRHGEVAVVSSSPERFLSIDRDRRVQARPIKGTVARSADPARDEELRTELPRDEKTFAEHLMIVDLLRNDLGRVCEVDSVRVPELMVVEPYPTVHQLISTVTGVLEADRTPVDCVRACFPGGSMTGAPKLRTMGIIDGIERAARGVYSGALGYFGLDGSVDLSIVIRTIVLRPGATTIGAGGAIVMQSDPDEEFAEVLLKARAPMAAIARAVTGSDAPEAWTVELEPTVAIATAV
jgi:para-aminobenzoate synthetase